jgi:hypothetical protein
LSKKKKKERKGKEKASVKIGPWKVWFPKRLVTLKRNQVL